MLHFYVSLRWNYSGFDNLWYGSDLATSFVNTLTLQELSMVLDCRFDLLRLDADVPLRGGGGTMLQQPLHQRYVKAVCVVDFRCIPLAEAVGTDTLVPQVIAHDFQLLLDCPF